MKVRGLSAWCHNKSDNASPQLKFFGNRRAEIWKLIGGVAGVVISDTDEETELQTLNIGDIVNLKCGERHRLVGTDGYGIVVEIWQHVDKENPSGEDDIVRVQDDFGR